MENRISHPPHRPTARITASARPPRPETTAYRQFVPFLPREGERIALHVGGDGGDDFLWLRDLGFEVFTTTAAAAGSKPVFAFDPANDVRHLDDRLPFLEKTQRLGLAFDVILMTGGWERTSGANRDRAFRKLITLLRPGGTLLTTVDQACADDGAVTPADVERIPDEGVGALPLLRGIILNDQKRSTYKLALLRSIARLPRTIPLSRSRAWTSTPSRYRSAPSP